MVLVLKSGENECEIRYVLNRKKMERRIIDKLDILLPASLLYFTTFSFRAGMFAPSNLSTMAPPFISQKHCDGTKGLIQGEGRIHEGKQNMEQIKPSTSQ